MKKVLIKVEKTETGFSAYSKKYPAFTTSQNAPDLITNMVDSLNGYFEAENLKKRVSPSDLSFEMDLTSVFDVFPINVKALSRRIGMNYTLLSQYATGRKKPSRNQTHKILNGIHEVGRELTEVKLMV